MAPSGTCSRAGTPWTENYNKVRRIHTEYRALPHGKCVYCKHCHPCPAGLDVALINEYYDLARLGDGLAREHYLTLEKQAGDCVGCGHCDGRCPFHVAQSSRMQEILAYFGA